MSHTNSRVGGTCIEDVVKCLAHNKPLTCAAEASDYIDIYSKNQQEYELRARDWFHVTIEFERSIQASLKPLLEKIIHADDPAIKQLNESHQIIKSRFDDIRSALQPLLVLHTPLTTPPTPSVTGTQLTQLTAKVNEMENLLYDASRSAAHAKGAISELEVALTTPQTSPVHSCTSSRVPHEDKTRKRNFHLANIQQMYSTFCEEYGKLVQDSILMTERISTNHSTIDSLFYILQQRVRTDCGRHLPSTPTLGCELGRTIKSSIPRGAPLVASRLERCQLVWWGITSFMVSLFLLPSTIHRTFHVSPSQPKQPYSLVVAIGVFSIGFLIILIAWLRQSEGDIAHKPPEGRLVPSHPIWDSLLTSKFDALDESATRMVPTRVT